MNEVTYESILISHAFCDFKLLVNGQTFLLHRAILNQRCNYFQKLFKNDPSLIHTQVQLPEDLLDSFDALLLWIYGSPDFHVHPSIFCSLTRLALFFDAPSLLDSLLFWMSSNLDYSNVLNFYTQLRPYKDQLPSFFSTFLKIFIRYFENIDFKSIASSLPFDYFYEIITDKRLYASSYKKSLAVVIYLDTNKSLQKEEKAKLLDFYIETDWIVKFSTVYLNSIPEKKSELINFATRHFSSITFDELQLLPQEALIELLTSDNLDLRNDSDLVKKCKVLTEKLNYPEDDPRIKEIWSCVITGDPKKCDKERKFSKRTPSTETLRCLVLGSVMDDMLDDVEQTLIENGLQKKNIVLINGDILTPTLDFFFQFDVVFVFTHYQFQSPKVISRCLTKFAIHRGGGVVVAYGFMRDDDWGCGDDDLLKLMPFTRGPVDFSSENTSIRIHYEENNENSTNNALNYIFKKMENMDKIKLTQFFTRTIVQLKENSHLFASYYDGVPFAAYSDIPGSDSKFVGLNYSPITSRVHRFGINPMVPMAHFLAAAVKFSIGISNDK
ncbi:Leucine-zipper-like transcriptional regulator 1 [Tritrichomonas musculus]|uniref:Leucine-zipper-like transcriptional regulator 1 n=1 Tax=Tritrichomonas musculus TaxID=1915356 RepID=A0ABR2KCI6_9EUKA